jgi:hypothetical protein
MKTKIETCGDCGVEEGDYHEDGCDQQICPFCGRQLICCECVYILVGIEKVWNGKTNEIPEPYYSKGMEAFSDEQLNQFDRLTDRVNSIPFILFPNMCDMCGELWSPMFMVPNDEWLATMGINHGKYLCRNCYDKIKIKVAKGCNPNEIHFPGLCARCGTINDLVPMPYDELPWLKAYAISKAWDYTNMLCRDCWKFILDRINQ